MSHFVKPNREQLRFQSLDLEKLIPENHQVRFFWKVCEELDLESLYADYKITENSEGRPANDPRVLLCLWIYAYSQSIQTSRLLAEACKTRADFIWLCGDITPEYRTLAYFRINHTKAVEDAFCKVVITLEKLGLIKEKVFFQDGTKIMADVSPDSFLEKDKLEQERLKAQIAYQHFTNYPEASEGDKDKHRRKKEKKLKERLEKTERAIERVNELWARREKLPKKDREQYPPEKAKISLTDTDSQFMKIDGRTKPGYNAQICVDEDSEIIVGEEVSNEPTDANRLCPVVEVVKDNLGVQEIEGAYVTDNGYYKDENVRETKQIGVKNLILPIYIENPGCLETKAVKERSLSEVGKGLLRRRKSTVERIFGFIKEKRLKLRRFNLRGLLKVGIEWTFICLAYNLIRYFQIAGEGGMGKL